MMQKSILAGFLLLATPSFAADNALGLNSGKPIAVNAESFTADLNGETGTFAGNVVVVQGDVRMRADTISVAAPGGRYSRMDARGNVVVDSLSGTARGASAVYDVPAQIIRMAGPVVLTKDGNILRGTTLIVEVATGLARLDSQGQGRVQGLFLPQQAAPGATPQAPPATTGNP